MAANLAKSVDTVRAFDLSEVALARAAELGCVPSGSVAEAVAGATPMGGQAQGLYAVFEGLGYGNRDFSAILQMMRGALADLG